MVEFEFRPKMNNVEHWTDSQDSSLVVYIHSVSVRFEGCPDSKHAVAMLI
jgi:hypothetical protein